ncbi:hypothetical protein DERP_005273 [Dermatophagoides pteronyssinus]|uniref:Uncharacterized protein n=1 Tax=Dermatophagoides pteronyssinus TaxID=6956 RepID=A0ABQ8JMJ1_DERPT|nr:hypothetical protein DERP_005273 [Dermatophagoides pteronyssinus]
MKNITILKDSIGIGVVDDNVDDGGGGGEESISVVVDDGNVGCVMTAIFTSDEINSTTDDNRTVLWQQNYDHQKKKMATDGHRKKLN